MQLYKVRNSKFIGHRIKIAWWVLNGAHIVGRIVSHSVDKRGRVECPVLQKCGFKVKLFAGDSAYTYLVFSLRYANSLRQALDYCFLQVARRTHDFK